MASKLATLKDLLKQTETVMLPSQQPDGLEVEVKCPDLPALIMEDGNIPDLLTGIVMTAQSAKSNSEKAGLDVIDDIVAAYPQLEPLVNRIAVATLVNIKLSLEPDKENFVGNMRMRDRIFLVWWALGEEFGDLSRFLTAQRGGAASVPTVPTVAFPAKHEDADSA